MSRFEEILLSRMTVRRWILTISLTVVLGGVASYIAYDQGRKSMAKELTEQIVFNGLKGLATQPVDSRELDEYKAKLNRMAAKQKAEKNKTTKSTP